MRKLTIAILILLATVVTADDFSYVFTGSGQALISGDIDIDRVVSISKKYRGGDFLWVKRSGREYLIRNAATIAEARAAFAAADALHPECERIRARMRPLERREEELEDRMDRLSDDEDANHDAELRALEAQLKPIARELRALEREEEQLDQREEKLVAVAEQELRRIVDRAIRSGVAERLR